MIKKVLKKDGHGRPLEVLFLTRTNEKFLVEYNWIGHGGAEAQNTKITVYQWIPGWKRIFHKEQFGFKIPMTRKALRIIKMFSKDYTYEVANRELLARKIARA